MTGSLFKWSRSIDCDARIFFFKTKNCLNDDPFISCSDRTGKMLHNICISAVAKSLRWASRGPWASCSFFNTIKRRYLSVRSNRDSCVFTITRTHHILTLHDSSKLSYVHYYIFTWYTYKSDILTLNMLGKNFSQRHFDFPEKIGFDISCKLSPVDSLHELWKPIFWGKKWQISLISHLIKKTRLFKYTENFTTKKWKL